MNRTILLLLLSTLPLFAEEAPPSEIPARTSAAIQKLRVGVREDDVVALLRPLSLDFGRVSWGGTGSGRLYFRVSTTQQLWVEIDGTKGFVASAIGTPEPLGVWTRLRAGGVSVQPRKSTSKSD